MNRSTLHSWPKPPQNLALTLTSTEVHIWQASLNVATEQVSQLQSLLSPDEIERSRRFRYPHLRSHFIAGRSFLRLILNRYANLAPNLMQFRYDEHDKPFLLPSQNTQGISFNLSHSNGLALYAFTLNRAVGIDVEHVRPMSDALAIARTHFSPVEQSALQKMPASQQTQAFFNCWTRKEAYIKAIGLGLSMPLAKFSVTLRPEMPAKLLWVDDAYDDGLTWHISHLDLGTEFIGALAIAGNTPHIQQFQFTHIYH